jgi:hypothetical protein
MTQVEPTSTDIWIEVDGGGYQNAATGEFVENRGDLPPSAIPMPEDEYFASVGQGGSTATMSPSQIANRSRSVLGGLSQDRVTGEAFNIWDTELGIFSPRSPDQQGPTRSIGQMLDSLTSMPTDDLTSLQMLLWQSGMYFDVNPDYYTGEADVPWGIADPDTFAAFEELLARGVLNPGQTLSQTASQLVDINRRRLTAAAYGRDEEGRLLDGAPVMLSDIALTDPARLRETLNAEWRSSTGRDAPADVLDNFVGDFHRQQRAVGERQHEMELAAAGWERDANGDLVRIDEEQMDPNELAAFREAYQSTLGQRTAFSEPGMSMLGDGATGPAQQARLQEWWEMARQSGFPLPRPDTPIGRQAVIDWYLERSYRLTGGDWEQVARMWDADTRVEAFGDPLGAGFLRDRRPGETLEEREQRARDEAMGGSQETLGGEVAAGTRSLSSVEQRIPASERAAERERNIDATEAAQEQLQTNRLDLAMTNFWTALQNRGLNPQLVTGARAPTGSQTVVGQGTSNASQIPVVGNLMPQQLPANLTLQGNTPATNATTTGIPVLGALGSPVIASPGTKGTAAGIQEIIGGATIIAPDATAQASEQARLSDDAAYYNTINVMQSLMNIIRRGAPSG